MSEAEESSSGVASLTQHESGHCGADAEQHCCRAAIRCYVKLGNTDEQALYTAEFFERMNDVFDLVNSCSVKAKHPMKVAVTVKNVDQRVEAMKTAAVWMEQWKVRGVKWQAD